MHHAARVACRAGRRRQQARAARVSAGIALGVSNFLDLADIMSSAEEISRPSTFKNYFGLELLYKSCNESLHSKADPLVVLAHYLLVRNRKRCAGIGEVWGEADLCTTEVLPVGWNENQGLYTIRYISAQDERYLLKALKADNSVLICVLDIKEDKTASTTLSVDKYVSEEYRDYSRAFKDLNAAIEKINREVINALGLGESEIPCVRGASSATSCERDLRVPTVQPYVPWRRLRQPAPLGHRDLDPFFVGPGGGIIMDPRELTRPVHSSPGAAIPGMPRAPVPPGSRFEPFGPPSTNDPAGLRFSGPNPNPAMRPPDYDDVFS